MLGNATTTMYWSSETISIANDSSASVAPLRSRASGTPCGSGRPAAAPVSAADPGTESLPPARIPRHPVELFPGLLVRGPARAGHLGGDELPGQQPPEPGGQAQRRLGARDLGQIRQPLGDRCRVVVHDVVDARRALA